jgi:hypothetical protein
MRKLLIASVAITVLMAVCTFDDFLSLHDIKADYVSKSVLHYLHVETSEPLPSWTDTTLEWTSITISYAVRSILILLNLVVLVLLIRRVQTPNAVDVAQK